MTQKTGKLLSAEKTVETCCLLERVRNAKDHISFEIYKKQFDDIRHEENGVEFWYARELMELLEYAQWRNFEKTIDKAKISCENNGIAVTDHFADVSKMIKIGREKLSEIIDMDILCKRSIYRA